MDEQYDREANWIAESCADNEAYAIEAAEACWAALGKLDKDNNNIGEDLRKAITGLSYLVGSTQRLKGYYRKTSDDITAETITPKTKAETPLAKAGKWLIGK